MADSFTKHNSVVVTDEQGVPLPEYQIPKLRSFLQDDEETQAGIASLAEEAAKDPVGVAWEMFASRKLISWMTNSYKVMTEGRRDDGEVAWLGKALHARVGEMMWDTLTLCGQADIAITDIRETRLLDCLTPGFASKLKKASMSLH